MVIKHCRLIRAPWLFAHPHQPPHLAAFIKDSTSSQSQPPPLQASPGSRIPPSALFIIVIVAVLFFIAGLLHLLFRFLSKKQPLSPSPRLDRPQPAEFPAPDSLHRQLQQLFHLHDSGLDQVFIDTLPVFLYEEIVGSKEPFDCAVCLCEFAQEDKLRLLPVCGHAFHVNCIDTWLLANSTCPLCRGALFPSGLPADNPVFGFEDSDEEDESYRNAIVEAEAGDVFVEKKRVFSVRLGKFKNLCSGNADNDTSGAAAVSCMRMEEGETSSNNLDPRRCFSMGYYQYVVADSNLQVELISRRIGEDDDVKGAKGMGISERSSSTEVMEGKKLGIASRGESFSVSKIWQLSNKKGKFPVSTGNISPLENLSWIASVADA